ncbi:MAG TPA: sigma-70 family RNA polymerase sigma factor, partial [Pirellulales bacterium]
DAQDVVQEALVQAYLKLATFQRTSAFYTWLYRIAFNVAMTQRRKKRPTASIEESREAGLPDPIDDGAAPSARMEQLERAHQVQTCLAALSEEHRSILVLKDVDDLRYEEIAEILQIPIGTVRSRLFRARMQLKEKLKEVLQEDPQT